jgi:hypothetical protein
VAVDPEVVDDERVGWEEPVTLHALTIVNLCVGERCDGTEPRNPRNRLSLKTLRNNQLSGEFSVTLKNPIAGGAIGGPTD